MTDTTDQHVHFDVYSGTLTTWGTEVGVTPEEAVSLASKLLQYATQRFNLREEQ